MTEQQRKRERGSERKREESEYIQKGTRDVDFLFDIVFGVLCFQWFSFCLFSYNKKSAEMYIFLSFCVFFGVCVRVCATKKGLEKQFYQFSLTNFLFCLILYLLNFFGFILLIGVVCHPFGIGCITTIRGIPDLAFNCEADLTEKCV